MKVWIESQNANPIEIGGKSLFCHRLGVALSALGFGVTSDPLACVDVSINVIRIQHERAVKKLLRLDGVWHDTGRAYKQKNESIASALRACDAVVYQSRHAMQLCNCYLGAPDVPSRIIYNGSVPKWIQKQGRLLTDKIVFLAFSKWRPHKRLTDIIESFLLADIDNSVLYVAGTLEKSSVSAFQVSRYTRTGKVLFVGTVQQDILACYLNAATAVIHLCWFDACPNSVVESLCAGVPVVCNNVGGTHELVECAMGQASRHVVCDIDEAYDLEPVDLYHPPTIDRYKVAAALRACVELKPRVHKHALSITKSAQQYASFMESLL